MRPASIWRARSESTPDVEPLTPAQRADKKRLDLCWSYGWKAGFYDDLDRAESPCPYEIPDEREAWQQGYLSGGRSRTKVAA